MHLHILMPTEPTQRSCRLLRRLLRRMLWPELRRRLRSPTLWPEAR
jgi:hypothetical protein